MVVAAVQLGIPAPAFSAALAYYDGYRSERLPANLLQAQRDYFGAHTYNRIDKAGVFHSDWLRLRNRQTRDCPDFCGRRPQKWDCPFPTSRMTRNCQSPKLRKQNHYNDRIHRVEIILKDLFGLNGQTAVVIGGAGVLGGALCAGLTQAGAHVIVADLTDEGCQARVEALQNLGGRPATATVNVTSPRFDREPAGHVLQADRPRRDPRQLRGRQRWQHLSRCHRRRLGPHA